MSTTVIACIQQVPQDTAANDVEHNAQDSAAVGDLAVQEISATAEDYLSAVDEVHSRVPDGWRVMYVRTDDASPVPEHDPSPDSAPAPTGTQDNTEADSETTEQVGDQPADSDPAAGGGALPSTP